MVTPSGMVLDGKLDRLEGPPATARTRILIATASRTRSREPRRYLEFYLLNYFKPATYKITQAASRPELLRPHRMRGLPHSRPDDRRDRRVADVETVYDPSAACSTTCSRLRRRCSTPPTTAAAIRRSSAEAAPFVVRNIYTDFKRHDLGTGFYERNYDGTMRREFMTTPLWGVGTTAPYGHDGRSINLKEVILRHGGEAQTSRDAFERLPEKHQGYMLEFLHTLVLFPPDDTASNLNPGDSERRAFRNTGTAASGCRSSSTIRTIPNNSPDQAPIRSRAAPGFCVQNLSVASRLIADGMRRTGTLRDDRIHAERDPGQPVVATISRQRPQRLLRASRRFLVGRRHSRSACRVSRASARRRRLQACRHGLRHTARGHRRRRSGGNGSSAASRGRGRRACRSGRRATPARSRAADSRRRRASSRRSLPRSRD